MSIESVSTHKVDFALLKDYYEAYHEATLNDDEPMALFKASHPLEYKHFSAVHHKRMKVRSNIEYLASTTKPLYFGTLTFNNDKNDNSRRYKLQEVFKFLNGLFSAFLLVEELGEEKGRYHIHFVGVFQVGKSFEDFKDWHSRQNLEKVEDVKKASQYLVKYASKQLPRIRRNKGLIALEKGFKKVKALDRARFSPCAIASLVIEDYN